MARKKDDSWESKFTVFDIVRDENGIKKVSGRYLHNSTSYAFSMSRQNSGSYLFRGSVRAIGRSGTVIKKKSKQRTSANDDNTSGEMQRDQDRKLSTVVYCNSANVTDLQSSIVKGVIRLFAENASLIGSELSLSIRPDSITPAVAAQTKAEKYVIASHKDASEETQRTIVRKLQRCCAKLPNVPMMNIKKTTLTKWLDENMIGRDTKKELYGFWKYCIDFRICYGSNPVDVPPKKRKSVSSFKGAATRFDLMTIAQQDMLYDMCRKSLDGRNVGLAMMLGSGLPPKNIEKLSWGEITFCEEYDFVIVRVEAKRMTGATHNYSRPIFPQAAEIVHRRFDELSAQYGKTVLRKMPVVSSKANPESPMSAATLIQFATLTLQKLFKVSYEDLYAIRSENPDIAAASKVFADTYKQNLLKYCRLEEDTGSFNFLMANAFGSDTSNDSYISFTSPEGSRRLYSVLKCLQEEKPMRGSGERILEDGSIVKTFSPKNTRSYIEVISDILLQPGEEICIECPHGVKGYADARGVTETGRRKKLTGQIEMEF